MANGTPPAVPAWIQTVSGLVTTVGVPTVVAGVLLWFVLTRVDTALRQIQIEENLRTEVVSRMQQDLVATLDKQTHVFTEALDKQTDTFVATMQQNVGAIRENTTRLERALIPRGHPQ